MNNPLMSCEEAIKLIATYIDHELSAGESEEVRAHIDRCKSCYSRVEFEQNLKAQLGTLGATTVSAELAQRIRFLMHGYTPE